MNCHLCQATSILLISLIISCGASFTEVKGKPFIGIVTLWDIDRRVEEPTSTLIPYILKHLGERGFQGVLLPIDLQLDMIDNPTIPNEDIVKAYQKSCTHCTYITYVRARVFSPPSQDSNPSRHADAVVTTMHIPSSFISSYKISRIPSQGANELDVIDDLSESLGARVGNALDAHLLDRKEHDLKPHNDNT